MEAVSRGRGARRGGRGIFKAVKFLSSHTRINQHLHSISCKAKKHDQDTFFLTNLIRRHSIPQNPLLLLQKTKQPLPDEIQ